MRKVDTNRLVSETHQIWKDLLLLDSPNVHSQYTKNQRKKANFNCKWCISPLIEHWWKSCKPVKPRPSWSVQNIRTPQRFLAMNDARILNTFQQNLRGYSKVIRKLLHSWRNSNFSADTFIKVYFFYQKKIAIRSGNYFYLIILDGNLRFEQILNLWEMARSRLNHFVLDWSCSIHSFTGGFQHVESIVI